MSHEERFPSPNAESALGRNCIGGGAWAKLATELVWGGLVLANLVLSGLGKAREVGLG